jgi:hypothetical protein
VARLHAVAAAKNVVGIFGGLAGSGEALVDKVDGNGKIETNV